MRSFTQRKKRARLEAKKASKLKYRETKVKHHNSNFMSDYTVSFLSNDNELILEAIRNFELLINYIPDLHINILNISERELNLFVKGKYRDILRQAEAFSEAVDFYINTKKKDGKQDRRYSTNMKYLRAITKKLLPSNITSFNRLFNSVERLRNEGIKYRFSMQAVYYTNL